MHPQPVIGLSVFDKEYAELLSYLLNNLSYQNQAGD